MNTNNSNQNKSPQDPTKDPVMWLLVAIIIAAVLHQKADAIQLWFYNNMLSLAFTGILLLVALGLYIRHRIHKKDREFIERTRNLKSMRPQSNHRNYYDRKHFDD
jgi:hypothetical protein